MRYRGVGFFPSARRPQVFWCGVQASANLALLAADIERALEPLGIPRESRAFVPHLTLARSARLLEGVKALAGEAEKLAGHEFGSARETEFHLFESTLKPGGAVHQKIASFAFARAAA